MTCFPKAITHDLNFNMPRFNNKFLHVHGVITKRGRSLSASTVPCILQVVFARYSTHSFSTTTGSSFDHHGIANLFSSFDCVLKGRHNAFRSRYTGYASFFHCFLSRRFVSHFIDLVCGSTNKLDAMLSTDSREFGVFT